MGRGRTIGRARMEGGKVLLNKVKMRRSSDRMTSFAYEVIMRQEETIRKSVKVVHLSFHPPIHRVSWALYVHDTSNSYEARDATSIPIFFY